MKRFVLLLIILITIITSGCFSNEENNKESDNNPHGCTYLIEIKTNNTGNYKIQTPIAINKNGSINVVMDHIKVISGNGNFSIVNTENGYALEISSNNNLELSSSISVNWGKDDYPILSLGNLSNNEYYIAGNQYNYNIYLQNLSSNNYININIYLASHYSYTNSDRKYQFDIKETLFPPVGKKEVKGYFKIATS